MSEPALESTSNSTAFSVVYGSETLEYTSREEAVSKAKSLSREHNGRVSVERNDGAISMQFTNGHLDSYVYELRERGSRRD
jgi:hypothetical protein